MKYYKFWNTPSRLYRASPHGNIRLKQCVPVPGCRRDPNDRGQPRRFEKWLKLPMAAHRLFWRHHKRTE